MHYTMLQLLIISHISDLVNNLRIFLLNIGIYTKKYLTYILKYGIIRLTTNIKEDSKMEDGKTKIFNTISQYNTYVKLDFDGKIRRNINSNTSYQVYEPKGVFSFSPAKSKSNTTSRFGKVEYDYSQKVPFMMSNHEMELLFFYVDKLSQYTLPNGMISSKILPSYKKLSETSYEICNFFHSYNNKSTNLKLLLNTNQNNITNIMMSLTGQLNDRKVSMYYTWSIYSNDKGVINKIPDFFSFMANCKLMFESLYPLMSLYMDENIIF